MASASLTPYYNGANQVTFALVTQGSNGATYRQAGRDLALPYAIEIQRKLTSGNSNANDTVNVTIRRVERNADTGKLATLKVSCEVSIPKDTSTLNSAAQLEIVGLISSLLNDSSVMAGTTVARTAIIEGRDL